MIKLPQQVMTDEERSAIDIHAHALLQACRELAAGSVPAEHVTAEAMSVALQAILHNNERDCPAEEGFEAVLIQMGFQIAYRTAGTEDGHRLVRQALALIGDGYDGAREAMEINGEWVQEDPEKPAPSEPACDLCLDGLKPQGDASTLWTCPKCGKDCIPF